MGNGDNGALPQLLSKHLLNVESRRHIYRRGSLLGKVADVLVRPQGHYALQSENSSLTSSRTTTGLLLSTALANPTSCL